MKDVARFPPASETEDPEVLGGPPSANGGEEFAPGVDPEFVDAGSGLFGPVARGFDANGFATSLTSNGDDCKFGIGLAPADVVAGGVADGFELPGNPPSPGEGGVEPIPPPRPPLPIGGDGPPPRLPGFPPIGEDTPGLDEPNGDDPSVAALLPPIPGPDEPPSGELEPPPSRPGPNKVVPVPLFGPPSGFCMAGKFVACAGPVDDVLGGVLPDWAVFFPN